VSPRHRQVGADALANDGRSPDRLSVLLLYTTDGTDPSTINGTVLRLGMGNRGIERTHACLDRGATLPAAPSRNDQRYSPQHPIRW
jgi:hypothetical protein